VHPEHRLEALGVDGQEAHPRVRPIALRPRPRRLALVLTHELLERAQGVERVDRQHRLLGVVVGVVGVVVVGVESRGAHLVGDGVGCGEDARSVVPAAATTTMISAAERAPAARASSQILVNDWLDQDNAFLWNAQRLPKKKIRRGILRKF
jgi:hypothetical protein